MSTPRVPQGKELSAPRAPNSPTAGSPSVAAVSIQARAHAAEAHTASVMLMGRRVRAHKGLITNLRYQTQSALEDQPTEPFWHACVAARSDWEPQERLALPRARLADSPLPLKREATAL